MLARNLINWSIRRQLSSSAKISLVKRQSIDGVYHIRIDSKYSSFTVDLLRKFGDALREANVNDACRVLVWTGLGDGFCNGMDLKDFIQTSRCLDEKAGDEEKDRGCEIVRSAVQYCVEGFIDFQKPIVAAVNGPAIGIGTTGIGLCDYAIARQDASYFWTPFTNLGFVPEACSTYTFPMLIGPAAAQQVLMFGKKLKPDEAMELGLINKVYDKENFEDGLDRISAKLTESTLNYLIRIKTLMRKRHIESLRKSNIEELAAIKCQWKSPEVVKTMNAFLNRKKN